MRMTNHAFISAAVLAFFSFSSVLLGHDGASLSNQSESQWGGVSGNQSGPAKTGAFATETGIRSAEDIHSVLQTRVKLEYDEVTFIEVMDELRDQHKINVILDQSARDDSLTEDELVTLNIENVTLATGLRLMLMAKNATYLVEDEVLRIISLDVATDPEYFSRRIFDCRELLANIARLDKRVGQAYPLGYYKNNPTGPGRGSSKGGGVFNVAPNQGLGGGGRGGFSGSQPAFRSAEHEIIVTGQGPVFVGQQTSDKQEKLESGKAATSAAPSLLVSRVTPEGLLIELVRTSIDAENWSETNGDGTLSIVGGLMVVNQCQQTLDELESFLEELKQRMK